MSWEDIYFAHIGEVRKRVPEGWSIFGKPKDDATPRFIIWRENPDGTFDQGELAMPELPDDR